MNDHKKLLLCFYHSISFWIPHTYYSMDFALWIDKNTSPFPPLLARSHFSISSYSKKTHCYSYAPNKNLFIRKSRLWTLIMNLSPCSTVILDDKLRICGFSCSWWKLLVWDNLEVRKDCRSRNVDRSMLTLIMNLSSKSTSPVLPTLLAILTSTSILHVGLQFFQ